MSNFYTHHQTVNFSFSNGCRFVQQPVLWTWKRMSDFRERSSGMRLRPQVSTPPQTHLRDGRCSLFKPLRAPPGSLPLQTAHSYRSHLPLSTSSRYPTLYTEFICHVYLQIAQGQRRIDFDPPCFFKLRAVPAVYNN